MLKHCENDCHNNGQHNNANEDGDRTLAVYGTRWRIRMVLTNAQIERLTRNNKLISNAGNSTLDNVIYDTKTKKKLSTRYTLEIKSGYVTEPSRKESPTRTRLTLRTLSAVVGVVFLRSFIHGK